MSEAELQKAVIEMAKRLGYRTAHFRTSRTSSGGWATAVQGDGAGFPDLVLARDGEVLFVELKSDMGRTSREQREWLRALPDDSVFLWRPADWLDGTVERVLRDAREKAA